MKQNILRIFKVGYVKYLQSDSYFMQFVTVKYFGNVLKTQFPLGWAIVACFLSNVFLHQGDY